MKRAFDISRLAVLIILVAVTFICTSCGGAESVDKPITVKWVNGEMDFGHGTMYVTSFTGDSATIEQGEAGLKYLFSISPNTAGPELTSINTSGVELAYMDKYKNMYYWRDYGATRFNAALEVAPDTYYCVQTFIGGNPPELVAKYTYDYLNKINLSLAPEVYCDFGAFKFGSEGVAIEVRDTGAIVTGVISVTVDSKGATEPVEVIDQKGKKAKMTVSHTDKYDYYEYGGYCIQVIAGLNPGDYLRF